MRRIGLSLLGICLALAPVHAQQKGLTTVEESPADVLEKNVGVRERYALLIGISKYANTSINLNYADADALELERVLLDPEVGGYKRENVKVLVNEDATRANIMEALKEWLGNRVKPEDSVVILYSGHGALGTNKDAYWVTHDADVNRLYATAINNKEISSLIADLPASRKLTLIDSCYSEATAKDLKAMVGAVFEEFKGEGVVTITASKGNQKSVEVNGHGAFTYHLLDALRGKADDSPNGNTNGVVELDEIWRYLDKKVRETAAAQNNDQQPTMTGHLEHEIPLTLNPAQAARGTLAKLEDLFRSDTITRDELKDAEKLFEQGGGSPQMRSLYRLLASGDVIPDNFRKVLPLMTATAAPVDAVATTRALAELEAAKKSAEATAYDVAKASESETGWNMYLSKFPESTHRDEARKRITELQAAEAKRKAEPGAYAQAENSNTESGWDNFIKLYPTSPLATLAQTRLAALVKANIERENALYAKAVESDLPADWDKLATDFPSGRYIAEAQRKKIEATRRIEEETAHAAAKKGDSLASWKAYLDKYPSGKFADEGKKRTEQLTWIALADVAAIPAGSFTMGSAAGQGDEKPTRKVDVDAFRMGKSEVTNELFIKFLDDTKRSLRPKDPDFAKNYMTTNPKYPVVNVTYADAADFCKWLSEKVGATVRLPTEAEWEYAALGGHDGYKFPWGNTAPTANNARFSDNAKSGVKTVDRDAFPANDYGLFNMAGNVAEWVLDYYSERTYSSGPTKNPTGPNTGTLKERVVRGGSYEVGADEIRVARRSKLDPAKFEAFVGFRIVVK